MADAEAKKKKKINKKKVTQAVIEAARASVRQRPLKEAEFCHSESANHLCTWVFHFLYFSYIHIRLAPY